MHLLDAGLYIIDKYRQLVNPRQNCLEVLRRVRVFDFSNALTNLPKSERSAGVRGRHSNRQHRNQLQYYAARCHGYCVRINVTL